MGDTPLHVTYMQTIVLLCRPVPLQLTLTMLTLDMGLSTNISVQFTATGLDSTASVGLSYVHCLFKHTIVNI